MIIDLYSCIVCGDDGAYLVTGEPDPPNGKNKGVGTVVCGSEKCAGIAVEWTLAEPCLRSSIEFHRLEDVLARGQS